MATSAVETQTTIMKRNGNTIAEVRSITGPSVKLGTVDASHLNSPDKYREFIGGLLDGGEVGIEGNFYAGDTNGQVGLLADMNARTIQNWTIEFPVSTGVIWSFTGLVTSYEPSAPLEDKLNFSATIKITGKPTMGITASTNPTGLSGIEQTATAVLDFIPNFGGAARAYTLNAMNTASTWIKLTVTAAAAESIVATVLGVAHVLTTGVQSEAIAIGAADTVTPLTLVIKDANKAPITIMIYAARP